MACDMRISVNKTDIKVRDDIVIERDLIAQPTIDGRVSLHYVMRNEFTNH